jgi:hypothetical protein
LEESVIPKTSDRFQKLQYAEIHYQTGGLPISRIWENWPEVYFDAPLRIKSGCKLPLFMVYRDADRFPTLIKDISVTSISPVGQITTSEIPGQWELNELIDGHVIGWLKLDRPGNWEIYIDACAVDLNSGNLENRRFRNQLSDCFAEIALRVKVLGNETPFLENALFGDVHCHSSGTLDQIEFGAPPHIMYHAAKAIGLDWFSITDHSYDLDSAIDDYTKRDTSFPCWQRQQLEIDTLNQQNGPMIIPGEELSCRSRAGYILHMLLINPPCFIRGSGDDGKAYAGPNSAPVLDDVLDFLAGSNCLAISAHSAERPGISERLLLGRERWFKNDLELLNHHQILSGSLGDSFSTGRREWIELLKRGESHAILAGNDAHGDFALRRRLKTPMLKTAADYKKLFGNFQTVVLQAENNADINKDQLTALLRSGNCLLTNGPLIWFESNNDPVFGSSVQESVCRLNAVSSLDFGIIKELILFAGSTQGEKRIKVWKPDVLDFAENISKLIPAKGWIRAEVNSTAGFAMTNAVYI